MVSIKKTRRLNKERGLVELNREVRILKSRHAHKCEDAYSFAKKPTIKTQDL